VSQEVYRVLAARSRRDSRRPEAAALGAAILLHALAIATAFILPHLQPRPEPLQFVPVEVIPAQALGVRRPAPVRRQSTEEKKPAPEEKPRPQEAAPPPQPAAGVPVLPQQKEKGKKPEPTPAQEERAAPAQAPPGVAPGETGDQLGRRGAAAGSPLGTTAFGSQIGVDNPEFTYGYYLDRLLSLIDAQWQRPNMGEVKAVIHFQIARSGSISGRSTGLPPDSTATS